ncbi:NACHT domain-containing protein [Streptomyces liangshanensis]|uniref:hypothetical protein n=1 Tax=Streptomyces liangshanensis TaxID=2717324 RepID=UPI0036DB202D
MAGSVGIALTGHHHTLFVFQPTPDEHAQGAVTLDDLVAAGRTRMVERWCASGLPIEIAKELADAQDVGALSGQAAVFPDFGVVVLEGDFGAGKSLAGERQHQLDIAAARADAQAPLPVRLAAKDVRGHLISTADQVARMLGDPAVRGVRLVVDGLDESGPIRGKELLDQGRAWVASPAGERWRIIATTRPGLELDPERCRPMPELSEDEAAALMDRLGGSGIAVRGGSDMVRSVLRRPLFAIIGAQIQERHGRLPQSPVAFLDALVTRALRDVTGVKEERAERLLQRLAIACVSAGGLAAAADVGSPGEVQALLETRLIVRRGDRQLVFALPVLEQYFAGQALLREGMPAEVMDSVELLDRWRYGLAMAISAGGWESVYNLLGPLVRSHPRAAAWATYEAFPHTAPENDEQPPDLSPSEVSRRLQDTMDTWRQALGPAGDNLFLYAGWRGPVTVDATMDGGRLSMQILRREGGQTPALAVPAARRWAEPRPLRPLSASFRSVAADYGAWPWQKTLRLLSSRLTDLCVRQGFDLSTCDAYTKERLWLAGADLCNLHSRTFTPLSAATFHQALFTRIYSSPGGPPVRSGFGKRFTGRRAELIRLEQELNSGRWADAQDMFHYPYAVPDQEHHSHGEWVWDAYSPERLRLRTEQVLTAALDIYTSLVETWFPRLWDTLGLAGTLPATLIADLYTPRASGLYDPPQVRLRLQPSVRNSVAVRLVASEDALYDSVPYLLPGAYPERSPWSRPATPVLSDLEVFDDAPATVYAYGWLHEDLHRLHLTDRGPRQLNTGLP